MKKLPIMAVSLLLLLGVTDTTQTVAGSAKPYYASLKLGAVMPRDADLSSGGDHVAFDSGMLFSVAVGINLKKSTRLELELATRSADIERLSGGAGKMSGDLKTKSLLANLYYDIPSRKLLRPYVSAGVGFARHDMHANSSDVALSGRTHAEAFLAQVGMGLSYRLGRGTTADLGYRFLQGGEIEAKGANYDFSAHEVTGGVRFRF